MQLKVHENWRIFLMNSNKKELLFISARFPYPPHKGDQLVLFNNIKLMSSEYKIALITMYDEDDELSNLDKLNIYCKEIITIKRNKLETYFNMLISPFRFEPLQVAYYRSKLFQTKLNELLGTKRFDVIHVHMLRMAHYVQNIENFKILSLIDSMALNMSRRVENESGIKKLIFKYESILVKNYERSIVNKFNHSIVVSNIDKNYIDNPNIEVVTIGIEMHQCSSQKEVNKIIFSGNMGYFPNQNAVIWFVENCFDDIKKFLPNTQLVVVGKNPPEKIKKYHDGKNIFIKGYVKSMVDELCRATIAIAPMQSGSGMQIKVLESMSVGLPVVATELGRGDISAEDNKNILIANTLKDFSSKCIKILNDENMRKDIGENAKDFIANNHSWETIKQQYLKIYKSKI